MNLRIWITITGHEGLTTLQNKKIIWCSLSRFGFIWKDKQIQPLSNKFPRNTSLPVFLLDVIRREEMPGCVVVIVVSVCHFPLPLCHCLFPLSLSLFLFSLYVIIWIQNAPRPNEISRESLLFSFNLGNDWSLATSSFERIFLIHQNLLRSRVQRIIWKHQFECYWFVPGSSIKLPLLFHDFFFEFIYISISKIKVNGFFQSTFLFTTLHLILRRGAFFLKGGWFFFFSSFDEDTDHRRDTIKNFRNSSSSSR